MKLAYTSVLLAAATLCAADSRSEDRKALVDHLQQSSAEFASAIKGLTPEQWNYKPAPDVWSVAECAEHIALSEDLLRELVTGKVLGSPAQPDRPADKKVPDAKVLAMITNRSQKAKAPEPLKPTGQFTGPDVALKRFNASRAKTLALAKSNDSLRAHALPHPAIKGLEMDGYQWTLYLSGHTMRHTAQILEVKASPGFPK